MSGHYSMKWDIWQHKGGSSKGWGDEWRGGVWGWAVMVPFWLQIRLTGRLFSDRPLNGDTLWRYMVGNWKAIRDLSLFIQLAHLKKPLCNVNGVSLSLSCVHLTSSSPRSMLSSTRLPHLSSNATEHSKGKVKSSHMDSHGSECKVEFILFLIRTYTGFLFALHKGGKKKKGSHPLDHPLQSECKHFQLIIQLLLSNKMLIIPSTVFWHFHDISHFCFLTNNLIKSLENVQCYCGSKMEQ